MIKSMNREATRLIQSRSENYALSEARYEDLLRRSRPRIPKIP